MRWACMHVSCVCAVRRPSLNQILARASLPSRASRSRGPAPSASWAVLRVERRSNSVRSRAARLPRADGETICDRLGQAPVPQKVLCQRGRGHGGSVHGPHDAVASGVPRRHSVSPARAGRMSPTPPSSAARHDVLGASWASPGRARRGCAQLTQSALACSPPLFGRLWVCSSI